MMVFRDEQYNPETADAASAGVNADTNIYVTPPARPAPQPIQHIQPIMTVQAPAPTPVTQTVTGTESTTSSSVSQPASLTQQYSTKQVTTQTRDMSGPKTTKHTGINWGGVIKGAAIVTAVVVVGIAAFAGASALAGWALGQPLIGGIAATVGEAAAPVATAVSEGASWLTGFVPHIPAAIGNFFSAAFGGGAAAAAAGTAGTSVATAALSETAIAGASTAVGAVAAGGAVAYTASHMAIPAIDHTSLLHHTQVTTLPMDHTTTTTTVTADPTTTTVAADAASSTEIVHHAGDGHASHTAADLGFHSFEFAHSSKGHDSHSASAQADTAAPDVDTSAGNDASAPDLDIPEGDLNRMSSRAQRNWASRAGSNGFADTAKTGGYRAAVSASRSNESSEIKQRGNDYRLALAEDRAKLDAALTTPSL